jgi:O-antigen/teichoic acid export membrane protein
MAKSVRKNYFYNLLYEIVVLVVPLITAPYLSRVLGADGVGVSSYTLSIVSYFILVANVGVSSYGSREIAMARDSKKDMSKTFWELFILKIFTGLFSLAGYLFFLLVQTKYNIIFQILALNIIANIFNITFLYQGIEHYKMISIRNIIVKITCTIAVFVFVKQKSDLDIYILVHSISLILSSLILWTHVRKIVEKVPMKELRVFRHFKNTLIYFLPQIATQIYTVLDKTMIGLITHEEAENGYYEQAHKLIHVCQTVLTSLNSVMYPRMSYLFKNKKFDEMKVRVNKSLDFDQLIGIPMVVGLSCISYGFVDWYFGPGFEQVKLLLVLFAPILLIIAFSNCIGSHILNPIGKRLQSAKVLFIGAGVNLVVNFLLIPRIASVGATIASVLAELVITIIYFRMAKDYLSFKNITKRTYQYIIAAIFMGGTILLILFNMKMSALTTVIEIIAGITIYFTILLMFKNDLVIEGLNIIKKKLNRNKLSTKIE